MINKKHYWIALSIGGLIISWTTLLEKSRGNLLFAKWHQIIDVFVLASLLVGFLLLLFSNGVIHLFTKKKHDRGDGIRSKFRIKKYIVSWWKSDNLPSREDAPLSEFVDLTGRRSRYSKEIKQQVVAKWERNKQRPNGVTLEEFLASEFGITGGIPNVSKGTFYYWRKQLKEDAKKEEKPKIFQAK